MPTVRAAADVDLAGAGQALSNAFHDDPVWRWLTPDAVRYHRCAPAFFAQDLRNHLGLAGEVLVDDQLRGAAVWCAPGAWRESLKAAARLVWPSWRLMGTRIGHGLRAQQALEKVHPTDPPHWYLSLLGTDPAHKGQGIGSALIREVTDRCDQEAIPAYLESSKESNVAFYRRHGFELTEVFHVPAGPPLWLMWREPR